MTWNNVRISAIALYSVLAMPATAVPVDCVLGADTPSGFLASEFANDTDLFSTGNSADLRTTIASTATRIEDPLVADKADEMRSLMACSIVLAKNESDEDARQRHVASVLISGSLLDNARRNGDFMGELAAAALIRNRAKAYAEIGGDANELQEFLLRSYVQQASKRVLRPVLRTDSEVIDLTRVTMSRALRPGGGPSRPFAKYITAVNRPHLTAMNHLAAAKVELVRALDFIEEAISVEATGVRPDALFGAEGALFTESLNLWRDQTGMDANSLPLSKSNSAFVRLIVLRDEISLALEKAGGNKLPVCIVPRGVERRASDEDDGCVNLSTIRQEASYPPEHLRPLVDLAAMDATAADLLELLANQADQRMRLSPEDSTSLAEIAAEIQNQKADGRPVDFRSAWLTDDDRALHLDRPNNDVTDLGNSYTGCRALKSSTNFDLFTALIEGGRNVDLAEARRVLVSNAGAKVASDYFTLCEKVITFVASMKK